MVFGCFLDLQWWRLLRRPPAVLPCPWLLVCCPTQCVHEKCCLLRLNSSYWCIICALESQFIFLNMLLYWYAASLATFATRASAITIPSQESTAGVTTPKVRTLLDLNNCCSLSAPWFNKHVSVAHRLVRDGLYTCASFVCKQHNDLVIHMVFCVWQKSSTSGASMSGYTMEGTNKGGLSAKSKVILESWIVLCNACL